MKDIIVNILEEEIQKLELEVKSLKIKMTKIIENDGCESIEKLNKLNKKKEIFENQSLKLYEMIGKIYSECQSINIDNKKKIREE